MAGLSYHFSVQNFEICMFPLFLAHFETQKNIKKIELIFHPFLSKMPKSSHWLPREGLTDSGNVPLQMRHGDTNDSTTNMWVRRGQEAATRQKVRWGPGY